MSDVKTELEDLTGVLIRGDVTPVVARLLKPTKHISELLRYLDALEDTETDSYDVLTVEPAPSFDDLFRNSTIVRRK